MGYFEKGKDYYEQGKYSQALEYFLAAMEEDKLNAEVYFWSALTYKSMNNEFGYRKNVFRALSIDPDNDAALSEAKLILGNIGSKKSVSNSGKTLPGFSVGPNRRIQFSPGNLSYDSNLDDWSFAQEQYHKVGKQPWIDVMGTSLMRMAFVEGKFDLFYWGCANDICLGYDEEARFFTEWGTLVPGNWRTLSYNEWEYLFEKRKNAQNLYGFSSVLGVSGVIILPDNWSGGDIESCYDESVSWKNMEQLGAAFLPTVGYYCVDNNQRYNPDVWAYQTCSHEKFFFRLADSSRAYPMGRQPSFGSFSSILRGIESRSTITKKYQLPVRLVKDITD